MSRLVIDDLLDVQIGCGHLLHSDNSDGERFKCIKIVRKVTVATHSGNVSDLTSTFEATSAANCCTLGGLLQRYPNQFKCARCDEVFEAERPLELLLATSESRQLSLPTNLNFLGPSQFRRCSNREQPQSHLLLLPLLQG